MAAAEYYLEAIQQQQSSLAINGAQQNTAPVLHQGGVVNRPSDGQHDPSQLALSQQPAAYLLGHDQQQQPLPVRQAQQGYNQQPLVQSVPPAQGYPSQPQMQYSREKPKQGGGGNKLPCGGMGICACCTICAGLAIFEGCEDCMNSVDCASCIEGCC